MRGCCLPSNTIDLGVMVLSTLQLEGWGKHANRVRVGWNMAGRIKHPAKPFDVWRREFSVESIRPGQNNWYEVLADLNR